MEIIKENHPNKAMIPFMDNINQKDLLVKEKTRKEPSNSKDKKLKWMKSKRKISNKNIE